MSMSVKDHQKLNDQRFTFNGQIKLMSSVVKLVTLMIKLNLDLASLKMA